MQLPCYHDKAKQPTDKDFEEDLANNFIDVHRFNAKARLASIGRLRAYLIKIELNIISA